MRILTVSPFYESHGGGIEIVAGQMARALGRRGHECRWASAGLDRLPDDQLIQAIPLEASDPVERWTGLPMPLPNRSARALLEREVAAADAVIVHDALYLSSLLAAHHARRHRKPWLLVQHIGEIPYTSLLLRLAVACANVVAARPLLHAAPQVVFISDTVRRYFAGSTRRGREVLLLNGVDHDLFRPPAPKERVQLRRRFGVAEGRRQLLFVGRFVEKKGLPVLRALASHRPEWDLLIVGGGPIDPNEWNLPNVHALGRKSRQELAELYRMVDALVLPSVGEGFPLVVQEAMASSLPVFCGMDSAAADPGAHEMLHGVAVNPADPEATAHRFGTAIAASPLGPDARTTAYARANYDWDVNARWLEERLLELRSETRPSMPRHHRDPIIRLTA